jgi:hypothetical protein
MSAHAHQFRSKSGSACEPEARLFATVREVLASHGHPLDGETRTDPQARFGKDFSQVRVHTDARAAVSADAVGALAYTVGQHIVFAEGQYRPGSVEGERLLAHELAHVAQHGPVESGTTRQTAVNGLKIGALDAPEERHADALAGGTRHADATGCGAGAPVLRRQPAPATPSGQATTIPFDLQHTPDISHMTDDELQERHNQILDVLSRFNISTPDTAALAAQAGRIGVEQARRRALSQGRTFDDDAIKRMREYFIRNARTEKDSCIVALNKGMALVTRSSALPTTNKSIEATMARLTAAGWTAEVQEIPFLAKGGRVTRGGARPEKLAASVWNSVLSMADRDPGWSVFTMSLLDGFHSVTLTLDASDPGNPHLYWSDQWKSKGGWKQYERTALDAEVTRLVQQWWDGQAEGHKHLPVVRLWRMRSSAP